jgi:hypothetical protein
MAVFYDYGIYLILVSAVFFFFLEVICRFLMLSYLGTAGYCCILPKMLTRGQVDVCRQYLRQHLVQKVGELFWRGSSQQVALDMGVNFLNGNG